MKLKKVILRVEKYIIKAIKPFNRSKYNKFFYLYLRHAGVDIKGTPRFISDDLYIDEVDLSKLHIEGDVTVSKGVTLLVHDYSVTQPLRMHDNSIVGAVLIKDIFLRKGCFIGANSVLLPGTEIGENTIVGAGSIIKGNISANSVVAGNPGKIVKSLDDYYKKISEYEMQYILLWNK